MILPTQQRFVAAQIALRHRWLAASAAGGHNPVHLERWHADLAAYRALLASLEELAQWRAGTLPEEDDEDETGVLTCEVCGTDYPAYVVHYHLGSHDDS